MKLLLDFNLSPRLVAMLADLFPDIAHLRTLGFEGETNDEEIWEYAKHNDFTILTTDSDFLELAARHGPPPKIIQLDNMNYRTRVAADLIRSNAALISEFGNNDEAVLVLRFRSA